MANEIERKYLVRNFIPELVKNRGYQNIEQFYISYNQENNVSVRARKTVYWSDDTEVSYVLCIKAPSTNPLVRLEFEKRITMEEYLSLRTMHIGKIINKKRYYMNQHFDLDVFSDGLILAEIEFKTLEEAEKYEKIDKPSWIGDEVTNNKEYFNSYIAGVSK